MLRGGVKESLVGENTGVMAIISYTNNCFFFHILECTLYIHRILN